MIVDLGLIDYQQALLEQKEFAANRRFGEVSDSLLIAQHPAVFTIGRTGGRKNLLVDEGLLCENGIKVYNVDRGGDITFHGPGQLVAYPIIDLRARGRDLHRYMRDLEEVIISFFSEYAVSAARREGLTGVWIGESKIASIGVSARDWVTYHGLSINLNVNTIFFSMINPCGMKDLKVTSLHDVLKRRVDYARAKKRFVASFRRVFDIPEG